MPYPVVASYPQVATVTFPATATYPASPSLTTATVSVDASKTVGAHNGVLQPTAFGLIFEGFVADSWNPKILGALSALNLGILRYDGGFQADYRDWQRNTNVEFVTEQGINYKGPAPIPPAGQGNTTVPSNTNAYYVNFLGQVVNTIGLSGMQFSLVINYGTAPPNTVGGEPQHGLPSYAANWVCHANSANPASCWDNHAPNLSSPPPTRAQYNPPSGGNPIPNVTYWELGNERYLAERFVAPNLWGNPPGSANMGTDYATNILPFCQAMKNIDPTIKLGLSLELSGDGQLTDWNKQVLQTIGSATVTVGTQTYPAYDFLVLHDFRQSPPDITDAWAFHNIDTIAQVMANAQFWIMLYCGSNAPTVRITASNSSSTNDTYPDHCRQESTIVNALFAADDGMTWLENGAENYTWFVDYRGIEVPDGNTVPTYPELVYGPVMANGQIQLWADQGMFSAGESGDQQQQEPPQYTALTPYYGHWMRARLCQAGDTMVSAIASTTTGAVDQLGIAYSQGTWVETANVVRAHAALRADGTLGLMLVNRDQAPAVVAVSIAHHMPATTWTQYVYSAAQAAQLPYGQGPVGATNLASLGPSFTVLLPPLSLTVYIM